MNYEEARYLESRKEMTAALARVEAEERKWSGMYLECRVCRTG